MVHRVMSRYGLVNTRKANPAVTTRIIRLGAAPADVVRSCVRKTQNIMNEAGLQTCMDIQQLHVSCTYLAPKYLQKA